jgi:hypothetical protein
VYISLVEKMALKALICAGILFFALAAVLYLFDVMGVKSRQPGT